MNEVVIRQTPGAVSFNYSEIKEGLENVLSVYRNMVFTEETKAEAKKTIAELRKQKKELTDRVKSARDEWMLPFMDFSNQAMSLIDMFDEPICFINEQIEAFEEQRIAEKRELIKKIYSEVCAQIQDTVSLEKIYNRKWENATFTPKAITEEMRDIAKKVSDGLETIRGFDSDVEAKAIDIFLLGFDVNEAIQYISRHEKEKAEILERERERVRLEEEERIRREERARVEVERKASEAIENAKAEVIEAMIPEDKGEEAVTVVYQVSLTPSAKEALEIYMDSIGIDWTQF